MVRIPHAAARIALTIALAVCAAVAARADERQPFGAMYADASIYLEAIAREQPAARPELRVTGISVPHHPLAADLMARGFWAAAGNGYERVIILSPDHFNRSRRPMATTRRDFDTVFGRLENDQAASGALLETGDLFEDSELFDKEHGVGALLPFVKHFFPSAKVVPIAMSFGTSRADWDLAFAAIAKLAGPRVLVIQSTDYSHYLPLNVAIARDQETLNVVAANDVDAIAQLVQPAHMDSKAAQYVQMRLQGEAFKSYGTVVANRNSDAYSNLGVKTTSYIVTVYTQTPAMGSALRYPDQEVVYFAGDAYLGRFLTAPLADADVVDAVVAQVKSITNGAPLPSGVLPVR
jgi:AmmeMemoRadiSam system protein B